MLADVTTAGWLVPGANAALIGTALWRTADPMQRSQLLLAASVAATVVVAGTGLAAHQLATGMVPDPGPAVAVATSAPTVARATCARPLALTGSLSDAELRAAIAW